MIQPEDSEELRRIIREELHALSELEVMTTEQVATLLKVHPRSVLQFVRTKGLPATQLPRTREYRFLRKQVIEWAFSNGRTSAA